MGTFIKTRVPQARKALRFAEHTGETWGIDCSCLMYRARGVSLSVITVIASIVVRLRRAKIRPIFIFDGKTPAAKSDVVDKRRVARVAAQKEMEEIRSELTSVSHTELEKAELEQRCATLQKKAPTISTGDRDDIKTFLHAAGILFITAWEEADDVLAYLCRTGEIQAVISTDMDMLARGVPTLIVPETDDATVLTEISLGPLLTGLNLTYTQFVDACMLMGSDYTTKGWRTLDPRSAVEAARRGIDWSTMDASGSMIEGAALLKGEGTSWAAIVGEKQRAKWDLGTPPKEPENLTFFITENKWPADWLTSLLA
jgi:XPG I-region/XPG N-terminal domain